MSRNSFHTFTEWLAEVQRIAGEEFNDEAESYAHFLFAEGVMPEEAAKQMMKW